MKFINIGANLGCLEIDYQLINQFHQKEQILKYYFIAF